MMSDELVRAGFRERLLRDRIDGVERPLEFYQELFPAHAELIASEYRQALRESADGTADERQFGPYTLERELGRGGQGIVYLASDRRLSRRVAIKVLAASGFDSKREHRRFHREAALAARLQHPGIAAVYEIGSHEGQVYVAMQYVEGPSLREEIEGLAQRGTSADRAELVARVRAFAEVARAVHHAHEAGILHRDLKPGNMILTREGRLVVLDFGLARDLLGPEGNVSLSGDVIGSPAYMPPEQIDGTRPLDARTDVYALGVTLYEWVTGRRPFHGATREALFRNILQEEAPNPRRVVPELPADLGPVFETALAKELPHRYQSALDFALDLEAVANGRPVSVVALRPRQRLWRWMRRDPQRAGLVLGLVAAGAMVTGLGGFFIASRGVFEEGRKAVELRDTERLLARAFAHASPVEQFRAQQALEQALAENPSLAMVRYYLAVEAASVGRLEQARALVAGEPADADEAAATRQILAICEQPQEALAVPPEAGPLELFVVGELTTRRASHAGLKTAAARADLEVALEAYQRAVLRAPQAELLLHLGLARVCVFLLAHHVPGTAEIGARVAEALASLWPESVAGLQWAAKAAALASPQRSIELTRACLELDPLQVDAAVMLAFHALDRRDLAALREAWDLARRALAVVDRPDEWQDYRMFAQFFGSLGLQDEGREALRLAAGAGVTDAAGLQSLGDLAREHGDLEAAIDFWQDALSLAPEAEPVSLALRQALRQQDQLEPLRAELERRLEVAPSDPLAGLELARLLLRTGEPEEAWLIAQQTLEGNEADPTTRDALIELQSAIDE